MVARIAHTTRAGVRRVIVRWAVMRMIVVMVMAMMVMIVVIVRITTTPSPIIWIIPTIIPTISVWSVPIVERIVPAIVPTI